MTTLSAITLATGRETHLRHTLLGLAAQTRQPDEVILVAMQEAPFHDLPRLPFPLRQITLPRPELPLAEARNTAATLARGDQLVFLDVDCIPDPAALEDYAFALRSDPGLLMGEVGYLPRGATESGLDFARFARLAQRHPDRQGPPPRGLRRCEDYRCFWSLNFAVTRDTWARSGGFDEAFTGYGGEDTDFARSVAERGIPIHWMKGGRTYHQHHRHFMPPVHHLPSILRNAEIFAAKWGHRTMEHWLYAFKLMGLIENTPDGLRILRPVSEADRALCVQEDHEPFVTTRRVLDHLQGLTGSDGHTRARRAEVDRAQAAMILPAAE
ncbi:glycosyltransferase family 2 protein [Dinoroseobacter sp. S375]|uniref:glycosyltransferase family 2 protein n=1 Tax=Dinoroseobacter sp. S375 TaxID=3415136 RepID=UPI003C7CAB14